MEPIRLIVIGDPIAQKRHRSTSIGGKVRQYDPSASDKGDFLSVIQKNAPSSPFLGPLRVDIAFFFPRPKSHYRTGANSHILKDNAPEWHISRPDRDNLEKFCTDSMKGVFWKDDAQLCFGYLMKKYSTQPRTEIIITTLT